MLRIKQSFADWSATNGLNENDAAALYRQAAEAGYSAVEMAPPQRWGIARELGLSLLNIAAPGMDEGLNDPENHPALFASISELIKQAAREKIQQIIVFSGKRKGQTDTDGIRHCAAALQSLAPLAERHNITLLLELLGQKCHPDYQADNIAFGAQVVRSVSSPSVKLLYDIYHMQEMGEAVIPAITEHLDCIGHLHVASPENRGEPTAHDKPSHEQIVRKVTQAGYRGLWGQEFLVEVHPAEALRRAYRLFDGFV